MQTMQNIIIVLIGIAALSFVLAVISVFVGGIYMNISAEALSRASSNISLVAIALSLWIKGRTK